MLEWMGRNFDVFPWFPENSLLCVILRYTVYFHGDEAKHFFFLLHPHESVTNHVLEWMGLNFYIYDGLQPKMSAGMI